MKNYLLYTAVCALCMGVFVPEVEARPVSYPGGWTVMAMNDADTNSLHMHYSPTAKYSVGYLGEYHREGKYQIHAAQLNHLMKRWNQPDSQGNLYLKTGMGIARSNKAPFDNETAPATFLGLATDWEDRRFFVSYENRYTWAGDIDDSFSQKARVGITPYIGEYGDLHTWLMLEVRQSAEAKDNVTVTPLIRVFKGVNLMEAGISNKGKALFNWVIRF